MRRFFILFASFTMSIACTESNGDNNGDNGDQPGANTNFCVEECQADDDCDQTFFDQECTNNRCIPSDICADNGDCTELFSGWVIDCTNDAGCPGQVCITVDGGGKCATEPGGFVSCDQLGQVEVTRQKAEDSSNVTVCANESFECQSQNGQNVCVFTCATDGDCTAPLVCDTSANRCVQCNSDADCAGGGKTKCVNNTCGCADDTECTAGTLNTCMTDTGICGCSTDADCAGSDNADVCDDGFCGCSDVSVCTGTLANPGTSFVCETF